MPGTPLAVFIHRRPAHTRAMLASLAACDRLRECDVHLFCDGARNPGDAEAVAEARAVANAWALQHSATVIARDENLGLARSIVSAVSTLVERHGRVIAVEDDLILNPNFLRFMLAGLDRFEHEERVLQISGFAFATDIEPRTDAIFLPLSSTWGWATWSRAWSRFRAQPDDLAALGDADTRNRFDLGGVYPYSALLESRMAGQNQSWGVLWYWAVFRANGLVLYPRESLVQVGGNDGTGTHGGTGCTDTGPQIPGGIRDAALTWPETVEPHEAVWASIKRDLRQRRAENFPTPRWPAKLGGWLKSRLHATP